MSAGGGTAEGEVFAPAVVISGLESAFVSALASGSLTVLVSVGTVNRSSAALVRGGAGVRFLCGCRVIGCDDGGALAGCGGVWELLCVFRRFLAVVVVVGGFSKCGVIFCKVLAVVVFACGAGECGVGFLYVLFVVGVVGTPYFSMIFCSDD